MLALCTACHPKHCCCPNPGIVVESEARAAELTQQVKACEVGIAAAQSERDEAQRQVAAWQGTLAELSSTQQQLSEHVEHIFAAPAWRAWPRHAELEAALAALAAQAAEVRATSGHSICTAKLDHNHCRAVLLASPGCT